jgi:hypothetical protein
MDAGADVCVTSVHKRGSGLEQGSVFHQQGHALLQGALDLARSVRAEIETIDGLHVHSREFLGPGRPAELHARRTTNCGRPVRCTYLRRTSFGSNWSNCRATRSSAVPNRFRSSGRPAASSLRCSRPIRRASRWRCPANASTSLFRTIYVPVTAGMVVPDAVDTDLNSIRVLRES